MDIRKYDEDFVKKYHDDAEDTNYLYEYKTGEFQSGEIVSEEFDRETDVQYPICDNC